MFWNYSFRVNFTKFAELKSGQKIRNYFFGYVFQQKYFFGLTKVAQMAKFCQIWSHCKGERPHPLHPLLWDTCNSALPIEILVSALAHSIAFPPNQIFIHLFEEKIKFTNSKFKIDIVWKTKRFFKFTYSKFMIFVLITFSKLYPSPYPPPIHSIFLKWSFIFV
jgi:hypothetical protein